MFNYEFAAIRKRTPADSMGQAEAPSSRNATERNGIETYQERVRQHQLDSQRSISDEFRSGGAAVGGVRNGTSRNRQPPNVPFVRAITVSQLNQESRLHVISESSFSYIGPMSRERK